MLRRKGNSKFVVKNSVTFLILLLHFFSAKSFAALPLTVEDLITKNDEFQLSFNVGYANADRSNVSALYDDIDTGNNNFIRLPVAVGEQRKNSDIYTFTLGGRYGLSKRTEIYSRLTAIANDTRFYVADGSNSFKSKQLNQLILGFNFQFYDDAYNSAILSFTELTLVENTVIDGSKYAYLKAGKFGLTTHRAIDPVVLSLTAGLSHSWLRKVNGKKINPGDLLFINPSIRFAVNDVVTLTGGVQLNFRTRDIIEDEWMGIRTSQTDLEFGIGYASSENLKISLMITSDISGDSGAEANIGWRYKFIN